MLQKIMDIARGCGQIMLSAQKLNIDVDRKTSWRDVVTDFDKRIQAYAVDKLTEEFPDAHFICEETDTFLQEPGSGELTFIIDPIDGTANFIHQLAHSCTSIACVVDGTTQYGVIFDPYRDEMFTAERGKGSYLNGDQIHVTGADLRDSMVLFGTAPYNLRLKDATLSYLSDVFEHCLDIRRTGSAALDLCYIAAGRAGLYYELELSLWDYAAGALIVEEAGGICRKVDGYPLQFTRPEKSSCMAGSAETVAEFQRLIQE